MSTGLALFLKRKEGNVMAVTQTIPPASRFHIVTINGATYEVTSNYIGDVSFLDLLKQILKRDLERPEE